MRTQYLLMVALLGAMCLPAFSSAQEKAAETAAADVAAVEVGAAAPDFSLPWLGKDEYALSSLQGDEGKYAAVVFVRAYG